MGTVAMVGDRYIIQTSLRFRPFALCILNPNLIGNAIFTRLSFSGLPQILRFLSNSTSATIVERNDDGWSIRKFVVAQESNPRDKRFTHSFLAIVLVVFRETW